MTHRWVCCCGDDPDEGCIFGWRVPQPTDPPACGHNTTDELYLNIPRPAYSYSWNWIQWLNNPKPPTCACTGINVGWGVQAAAQSDIEAKYSHYNGTASGSPQAGEDYPWFYDHGGLPGTANFDPSQLWPWTRETKTEGTPMQDGVSNCCGYAWSPGLNDSVCNGNSYNGPECSTTHLWYPSWGNRRYCTALMAALINTNSVTKINPSSTDLDTCDFPDGSFNWLQGISDNSLAQMFQHWEWDDSNGVMIGPLNQYHLAETLLCVAHQEKWWERYYNSISDEYPGNPGNCRTPSGPGWAFSCGGVPVFTHEIMLTHKTELDNLVPGYGSLSGAETIIRTITRGEPLSAAQCDGLVQVGIFKLADWGQPNGEPVKKTLDYHINRTPYTDTRYFFCKPGGWSFTCDDYASGQQLWPQIPRGISSLCANVWGDDFPGWGACMSAAPFPNSTEICYPGQGSCSGIYNGCNLGPPPGCYLGQIIQNRIAVESYAAECAGVLFKYNQYVTADPSLGIDPWKCGIGNEATLCVVPPGSTTCSLDLPTLRAALAHFIPEQVSQSERNAWGTSVADLCCGGQGLFQYGAADCPATNPNAAGC